MKAAPPIPCCFDGEAFVPLDRFAKLAEKYYAAGEIVPLVRDEQRNMSMHRGFFAQLREAHNNMPEHLVDRFPTVEHLRKKALIHCGYADERSIVCGSPAEALKVAAFIEPINEYDVVDVRGNVVTHFTAASQSTKAMGAQRFKESKNAVLDFVSKLIGVAAQELEHSTGRAA